MSPRAVTKDTETPDTPEKRALRVARIKQLVQQASSPHGDGQQAAYRACQLIRKFGLDIVDPELVDDLHKAIHDLRAQLTAVKAGADLDDDDDGFPFFQARPPRAPSPMGHHIPNTRGGSNVNTATFQTSPRTHPSAPFHPSVPVYASPPPPTTVGRSPMTTPVLLNQSQFNGKCKQCGKALKKGEPVKWLAQVGVWCPTSSCYNDWSNKQQVASTFNPFP